MKIASHILNDIKPLHPQEKVREVLDLMEELKYCHLPVLEEGKYLGLITEDDLLDIQEEEDRLEQHRHVLKPYQVLDSDHIFTAIKVIGEGNLTFLPVLNEEQKYLGYISPVELMWDLGRIVTFGDQGSVLVLTVPIRDYHISQIAQIVESEDALITGLHVRSAGNELLHIVVKINQTDISRIIKAFERYEYQIEEVYHQSIFDDTASDRYESLMNYLNI
jgi:predicted transcriptional regulator